MIVQLRTQILKLLGAIIDRKIKDFKDHVTNSCKK